MDLFEFREPYRVLICRECQYCVLATESALSTHLLFKHKLHIDIRSGGKNGGGGAATVARLLCKTFPTAIDQAQTLLKVPAPESPPIPGLALRRGLKCTQCDKIISDTKSGPAAMSTHFQQHCAIRRTRGGDQRSPHTRSAHLHEDGMPILTRVWCQCFFATHRQSSYFPVAYSPDQDATVNHAAVT
jgi:hypothetical protein